MLSRLGPRNNKSIWNGLVGVLHYVKSVVWVSLKASWRQQLTCLCSMCTFLDTTEIVWALFVSVVVSRPGSSSILAPSFQDSQMVWCTRLCCTWSLSTVGIKKVVIFVFTIFAACCLAVATHVQGIRVWAYCSMFLWTSHHHAVPYWHMLVRALLPVLFEQYTGSQAKSFFLKTCTLKPVIKWYVFLKLV